MSPGCGGGGVAGGGGVTGVVAADGGVSFGGALVWLLRSHAALVPIKRSKHALPNKISRFRLALVMAPLYHGRVGRGSDGRARRVRVDSPRDGSSRRAGPRSPAGRGMYEVRRAHAGVRDLRRRMAADHGR